MYMRCLLISGHGMGLNGVYDPGACGCGLKEAVEVRRFVPALRTVLKNNGVSVDIFEELLGKETNPYSYLKTHSFDFTVYDYVLEVHCNAANFGSVSDGVITGTECLVSPLEKGIGVEDTILNHTSSLGFRSRGIKRRTDLQNMNIVKKRQGVSYNLIELFFIDDLDDVRLWQRPGVFDAYVDAVARGICEGFGLPYSSISKQETVSDCPFVDVSKSDYFYQSVIDAYKSGLMVGTSENTFSPSAPVTRGDLAVVLSRLLSK